MRQLEFCITLEKLINHDTENSHVFYIVGLKYHLKCIDEIMSKKKAFALRINEDMLKAIEKWAADEFRSTNGQIEWMLMQYLKEKNRQPKPKKKDESDS